MSYGWQNFKTRYPGGLRTFEGLERFAKVGSYITTARKQGVKVAEVLIALFYYRVWIPPTLKI